MAYDREMNETLCSAVFLVLLIQGGPSPIVRFDSREQGRTFYVDTDRSQIRKALRDVSAPSPAGEIPDWVAPYGGLQPWGSVDLTPRRTLATMLSYARSVPLEPSARTDLPSWVAFYPGAKIIVANAPPAGWQPTKPADMRTYKVELNSTASVAQVGAFYRQTMEQHGLSIVSESTSEDRHYALEARTADRTHVVYVNVHKRPGGTYASLLDHWSWPRP